MLIFSLLEQGPIILGSWLVAIVLGITFHEYAHAWAADRAGDPTARALGRLTLNPLAHYDLIGTTCLLIFGFGWAKPVPINPSRFRRGRKDEIVVSAAGIGANLIIVGIFAGFSYLLLDPIFAIVAYFVVLLNLILAFFNLLPVPPLDGSHILEASLPLRMAYSVRRFYQRAGILPLVGLIMLLNFGFGDFAFRGLHFLVDILVRT